MNRMSSQVQQLDSFLKSCIKDRFPLDEFKTYLDKVEKNGENLEFYLWYQDYKLVHNFVVSKIINYKSGWGQINSQWDTASISASLISDSENIQTAQLTSDDSGDTDTKPAPKDSKKTGTVDELELFYGKSLPTLEEIDPKTSSTRSSMQVDDNPTLVNDITPWEINEATPWDAPIKNSEDGEECTLTQVAEKIQKMRHKCDTLAFTVPEDAPFRKEVNWAINHFFMHRSEKQLNLPESLRAELRDHLAQSTDPVVFEKIVDHIYLALRWQSFPSFLQYKKKGSFCNKKQSVLTACRSFFRRKEQTLAH